MPKTLEDFKPILSKVPSLDSVKMGALLIAVRESLGIQQKALAAEMKISASYLSDLEYGKRDWTMEKFERCKAALAKCVR